MRLPHAAALALLPLAAFRAQADPPAGNREPAPRLPAIAAFEDEVARLAESARPWLVQISCHYRFGKGDEDGDFVLRNEYSGAILGVEDRKAWVVTVASAVRGARRVDVILPGGDDLPAEVVGIDDASNLALVSFDPENRKLQAAPLANNESLKPGQFVLALGNPYGREHSVASGVVSGVRRSVGGFGASFTGLIQITAAINPGDAGGILLNSRGEVVGILSSTFQRATTGDVESLLDEFMEDFDWGAILRKARVKEGQDLVPRDLEALIRKLMEERKKALVKKRRSDSRIAAQDLGAEGINFAIPSSVVKRITGELRLHGKVDRGYLGVHVVPVESALRKHLGLEPGRGVEVLIVGPGSGAAEAGVEVHDVIVQIDGQDVRDMTSVAESVGVHKPGETVTLTIRRGNDERKVAVTLRGR